MASCTSWRLNQAPTRAQAHGSNKGLGGPAPGRGSNASCGECIAFRGHIHRHGALQIMHCIVGMVTAAASHILAAALHTTEHQHHVRHCW